MLGRLLSPDTASPSWHGLSMPSSTSRSEFTILVHRHKGGDGEVSGSMITHCALTFDLGKIRYFCRCFTYAVEQTQAVGAESLVFVIDGHLFKEGIDRHA